MTPQEKERVQIINQALQQTQDQVEEIFGDALSPEFISILIGSMMAAVDAVFAIRDGEIWRGLSDPKEIAARLLRDAHLGEV